MSVDWKIVGLIIVVGAGPISSNETGATEFDISGPELSETFGSSVTILPNGNIVITDPAADSDRGAVYLYDTAGNKISELRGSAVGDKVGQRVVVLKNGNFVVVSEFWAGTSLGHAGAVTWIDGHHGLDGYISEENSLVGTVSGSYLGSGGVFPLANGNYVVASPSWDYLKGAVTWGSGTEGVVGRVGPENSLVGGSANDRIGEGGVFVLKNDNYVASSPYWTGGVPNGDFGAATWGSGSSGVRGIVSVTNSLLGSARGDKVSLGVPTGTGHRDGVVLLDNGNYVVNSPSWGGGVPARGAVSFGDGEVGLRGLVSPNNSLVGSIEGDSVGSQGVAALSNGNYVVASSYWNNGVSGATVGAATWGDGTIGVVGVVFNENSLIGTAGRDPVGFGGVVPLVGGNYVVSSYRWCGNASRFAVGAATWGDGKAGVRGVVSAANSLVGTDTLDQIGENILPLKNGNYVVYSRFWRGVGIATWASGVIGRVGPVTSETSLMGHANSGSLQGAIALESGNYVVSFANAATFGNGESGVSGLVNAENSLVGTEPYDQISSGGVTALKNGNYVVSSPRWRNSTGAATWGNGWSGTVGLVSVANSFVGAREHSNIAEYPATALADGNYIINSPAAAGTGSVSAAGAITWGDGALGTRGVMSLDNSLIGDQDADQVGYFQGVEAASNGAYIVASPYWSNSSIYRGGAISIAESGIRLRGRINRSNSVIGYQPQSYMVHSYDPVRRILAVGKWRENKVTIFSADVLFVDGLE